MTKNDFKAYLRKLRDNNEYEMHMNVIKANRIDVSERRMTVQKDIVNFSNHSKAINQDIISQMNLINIIDDNYSPQDYINNLKPEKNLASNEEKHKFIILEYVLMKTLYSGEIFGDSLMSSSNNKR